MWEPWVWGWVLDCLSQGCPRTLASPTPIAAYVLSIDAASAVFSGGKALRHSVCVHPAEAAPWQEQSSLAELAALFLCVYVCWCFAWDLFVAALWFSVCAFGSVPSHFHGRVRYHAMIRNRNHLTLHVHWPPPAATALFGWGICSGI